MLNRIKQYRLAAGLTPQALSTMFKIPYGVILKWEKGELSPPLWVEEKIIGAMKNKAKDDMLRARARFRLPRVAASGAAEETAAKVAPRRKTAPPPSRDDEIVAEASPVMPELFSPSELEDAAQKFVALQEEMLASARAAAESEELW